MKQDALLESVNLLGVDHYFDRISGINDHYANGKLESAKSVLEEMGLNSDKCCLIGDTLHDYEVAKAMGCHNVLIANGHQNIKRLEESKSKVLKNINQLLNYF
jgi:phosphoglycolate phosphatase